MQKTVTLMLLGFFSLLSIQTNANQIITVNVAERTALLDGKCGNDEWDSATVIKLPAEASILVMYDADYFYLCARGKSEDYTVLDLYIEHAKTGQLHKFHLSAQMGERILRGEEWERASEKWDLRDYAGFWVPYSGLEDQENRKNPKFARGTHRQLQISRNKFPGDAWKMMIGVSGIKHNDNRNAQLVYPEKAISSDIATYGIFSFAKE